MFISTNIGQHSAIERCTSGIRDRRTYRSRLRYASVSVSTLAGFGGASPFVDKRMRYGQFYGRNGTDTYRSCAILRIDSMPSIGHRATEVETAIVSSMGVAYGLDGRASLPQCPGLAFRRLPERVATYGLRRKSVYLPPPVSVAATSYG